MPIERRLWHFAVLSSTGTGHLNPLIALAQELIGRGHRITFCEKPKIADRIQRAGLEFVPLPADRNPMPAKPKPHRCRLLSDYAGLRFNLKRVGCEIESYLRELPVALAQAGVEALIVDEIALSGPTVAEQLRLPYLVISTSVPRNTGWKAFSWCAGYKYVESPLSWLQSVLLEQSALHVHGPLRRTLDRHRQLAGLQPIRRLQPTYPPLAQITQLPEYLDLPNVSLPSWFSYTGPFISQESRPTVHFPWHHLDGRPIVYASLGTTRNAQARIFRLIAEACLDLDVQLIISLGGRFDAAAFANLPGRPVVVDFAPQLELLKLATLVITHGGSNTVLEALMEGKPMIAIPIAYDQPAVAARVVRAGAGIALPVMRLSARRIRAAILAILQDPAYRDAALKSRRALRSQDGAAQAARIIEDALHRYLTNTVSPNEWKLGCEDASQHSGEVLEHLHTAI